MSDSTENNRREGEKVEDSSIDQRLYSLRRDIRDELEHQNSSFKSEIRNQYELYSQSLANQNWKYFKIALIVLGFLGLTTVGGIYGAFKCASYETRKALDTEVKRARQEVSKRLDAEFESKEIQELIEVTAKGYTEGEVQKYISDRVDKAITPVQKSLDDKLQEASKTLSELQLAIEFTMTVIAAQSDDRKAFDQLQAWADDKSYPFSSRAEQVWNTVLDEQAKPWSIGGFKVPWREGVDPSKLTFEDLRQNYGSAPSYLKPGLLEYIWNRQDILKKDRMQFLVDVMQYDASLTAVEYAGRFFDSEANLSYKPLHVKGFLKWWEESKDKY